MEKEFNAMIVQLDTLYQTHNEFRKGCLFVMSVGILRQSHLFC